MYRVSEIKRPYFKVVYRENIAEKVVKCVKYNKSKDFFFFFELIKKLVQTFATRGRFSLTYTLTL